MARAKKKAGEAGAAKNFITRNQALKKLQLSLPDFRKLCIWKGIYPREPRSRKRANKSATASTTFYYAKDIQYLLHEPLIQKFRDQKVLEKKITRALGRGDVRGAKRLDDNAQRPATTGKPVYTLDHVVRERYPTFIDALRDLDDCLSMLFLFANLPSTTSVPARMVARCERLCLEFQHYLIVSRSLRKSFLSIKGIYYQANIQGEDILWLVPYKFNQRIVGDIDFRIMGTFVEFYMTLLGFVNFRLYTSINLKYPPKFDKTLDDQSAELGAFLLEGKNLLNGNDEAKQITENGEAEVDPKTQAAVQRVIQDIKQGDDQDDVDKQVVVQGDAEDEEPKPTDTLDKFEPIAANGDILPQPEYSSADPGTLFANFTFYLSRETPRQPLEFILKAFGCKRVGWDPVLGEGAYTTNELDPSITHQIVDRPPIIVANDSEGDGEDNQTAQKMDPNKRVPGRIYVQPQWVWDSVNDEELKRPDLYAPGASLPPHLSPFVKNVQGQYDPTMPLEEQEPEGEALEVDTEDEEDEDMEDVTANGDKNGFAVQAIDETVEGMDVAGSEDEEEEEDDQAGGSDFGGFSDEEREIEEASDDDEALQRQRELEAELKGTAVTEAKLDPRAKAKADAKKALARKAKEEAEELERAKGMLPKKKRKLYEKMIYSNTKKSAGDEKLRAKRRKLERQRGKEGA